jgi:hypothetical protein|tara:strand:- start:847 stop:1044 length:198 start_codon:yes stop_codon:yes gene_type:complete
MTTTKKIKKSESAGAGAFAFTFRYGTVIPHLREDTKEDSRLNTVSVFHRRVGKAARDRAEEDTNR